MANRAGMGKEAFAALTAQQGQAATQNLELMKAQAAQNLKLLELSGYDTANPIAGQDGKVHLVNKFGQSHDVRNLFVSDGSQFTSGAACNPTLTIVALAIRQADYIAGAMQKKEI